MTATALQRFLLPEPNIGGGDQITRVLASVLLLLLTGLAIPQAHVPFPLLKISLLIAAELGLVGVMLGMFLRSKTYFAGAQLVLASLLMLWLLGQQLVWVAAAVGLLFVAAGINELVTRRSRLNGLLGVSSFRAPTPKATLLGEALLAEPAEAASAPEAPSARPTLPGVPT